MFNHLAFAAQQSAQPNAAELFLNFKNLERSSCVVKWNVTLPAHLKAKVDSKALTGTTTILPSETRIVLGSWTLHVLPLRGALEGEVEAVATVTICGTDFKTDASRATLSSLLKRNP